MTSKLHDGHGNGKYVPPHKPETWIVSYERTIIETVEVDAQTAHEALLKASPILAKRLNAPAPCSMNLRARLK